MAKEPLGAESRSWRSLWLLFRKPGMLCLEYQKGGLALRHGHLRLSADLPDLGATPLHATFLLAVHLQHTCAWSRLDLDLGWHRRRPCRL